MFEKVSVIENFHALEGIITILLGMSFVSQCRNFSQGNPLVCHYFCVSKKFMPRRVMSRHSNETFFTHSSEKLRREQLLCFTKCPETKSFLDSRGEGREVV